MTSSATALVAELAGAIMMSENSIAITRGRQTYDTYSAVPVPLSVRTIDKTGPQYMRILLTFLKLPSCFLSASVGVLRSIPAKDSTSIG